MYDMIGQELKVGDRVCDSRFKLYIIRITPETVARSRVAYTDKGIVRLEGALLIPEGLQDIPAAYKEAAMRKEETLREELLQRKQEFQQRLGTERSRNWSLEISRSGIGTNSAKS